MKSFSDNRLYLRRRYLQIILIALGLLVMVGIYILLMDVTINSVFALTVVLFTLNTGLLWFGNTAINKLLNRKFPWLTFGTTRFFTQLILVLFYSLIIINGSYYLFKTTFTADPPTFDQLIVTNVYGTVIIVIVTSIYFGISFLGSWKKSELESERMQKEHIKTQLKALQNHLDPHFLFNNLNILSSLIDKDRQQSKLFLDQFAEVYRVLLRKDLDDIIPLQDEIQFLETYLYLIKIRFEEDIRIDINIPNEALKFNLPPMTLQMLVENAIKHNKISELSPLEIKIELDNSSNRLVITNTLNKKSASVKEGSGLENISKRYAYFTDQKISWFEEGNQFIVKIPLLQLEQG